MCSAEINAGGLSEAPRASSKTGWPECVPGGSCQRDTRGSAQRLETMLECLIAPVAGLHSKPRTRLDVSAIDHDTSVAVRTSSSLVHHFLEHTVLGWCSAIT